MTEGYRNFKIFRLSKNQEVDCILNRPIPCSYEFFIKAFWMPIKHQIGEKLAFFLQPDAKTFILIRNQAIDNVINGKKSQSIEENFEKIFDVALYHIDRIIEHMYCKAPTDDVIPFIDEVRPIASVIDNTITMNGRLPMQEDYFVKKYWREIAKKHHRERPGIRFKIHFSKPGTEVSVSAELCRYDAICAKKGLPKRDAKKEANYQIQLIICDLTEAITEAASEYAEACKKM